MRTVLEFVIFGVVGIILFIVGITLMPDKWWYWLVRKLDR